MVAEIGRPNVRKLKDAMHEPKCPRRTPTGLFNVQKWVQFWGEEHPLQPERRAAAGNGILPPVTWREEKDRQSALQIELERRIRIGELVEIETIAELLDVFAVEFKAQLDQLLIELVNDFPVRERNTKKLKHRRRIDQCLDTLSCLLEELASTQSEPEDLPGDAQRSSAKSDDEATTARSESTPAKAEKKKANRRTRLNDN